MHFAIVERLARSKILFFDSNPIGRILTRFSTDVSLLDQLFPLISSMMTITGFRTVSVSITLMAIYPQSLAIVFPLLCVMFAIFKVNTVSQREALRMDAIYRGPVNSNFSMIVNGLVSIRCYQRLPYFEAKFIEVLEKTSNSTFTYYSVNRWMGQ